MRYNQLIVLFLFLVFRWAGNAQNNATTENNIQPLDSITISQDTTAVDSIPPKKAGLDARVDYQAKDSIMDIIKFDYHNLKNDSGLKNVDVVFCRNVLIYFDEQAQEATVNRFWDAMAPQSFLFIGHAESLFGMKTKFEFLKTEWACLYTKNI